MTKGLITELDELIALKSYAEKSPCRSLARVSSRGNHSSRLRGRGMDFAEVRHYQAGDEIRHMEWRVTARTGRPHSKLYEEEKERPVVLLTDFSASMYFGTRVALKSVVAARLSALIAWTVICQGNRIGGLFFSGEQHSEFPPARRQAAVLPLIASLSTYTRELKDPIATQSNRALCDALQRMRRVVKPGSLIVLISDFYQMNSECETHLIRLRAHNDVLAYHVCDPLELQVPKAALYAMTNGQDNVFIDTHSAAIRDDYQNWCNKQQADLKAQFRRASVAYTQITAEHDLVHWVHRTFPEAVHA